MGVYARPDAAGATWERLSDGLPNVVVSDLLIHGPSGRLAAATYGRGVYMLDLPEPPPKTPPWAESARREAPAAPTAQPVKSPCSTWDTGHPPAEPAIRVLRWCVGRSRLERTHRPRRQHPPDARPHCCPIWLGRLLHHHSCGGWAPDDRSSNNTRATQSLRIDSGHDGGALLYLGLLWLSERLAFQGRSRRVFAQKRLARPPVHPSRHPVLAPNCMHFRGAPRSTQRLREPDGRLWYRLGL